MNKIRYAVGRGGRNLRTDVVLVQTLLNRHVLPPGKLLVVDGVAGPKTITSILLLQHRLRMKFCDGRVDPSGKTFYALLSAPKSVAVTEGIPFSLDHTFAAFAKVSKHILLRFKEAFAVKAPSHPSPVLRPVVGDAIAWGAKVSPIFKRRVIEICSELEISPDYLMTCMAFETGESFRADQPNLAGGSAIGLIQFTKPAWRSVGTTRDDLAKMTAVEQLEYVRKYFLPYKGRLKTLEDVYMVILCPAAVGKGPDGTLYAKDDVKYPQNYEANKGLDNDPNDGKITVGECAAVLKRLYAKGLSKGYFG